MAYYCDKCYKSFSNKRRYQHHLKFNHKDVKLYKCDLCNVYYTCKISLINHYGTIKCNNHEKKGSNRFISYHNQ